MNGHQALVGRLRAAGCVFAEREADLIATTFADVSAQEQAVVRREQGEPLEYVLGRAEFAGVTVAIGSPGFVPRARAEALIAAADRLVSAPDTAALDLGCGVGAIAAALTRRHPTWRVLGCDIDEDALGWARRNAEAFGFTVYGGSWFEALPEHLRGRLDLVLAHLPYVPSAEVALLPRDFRDHEPLITVDGGADGLDPLRAVAAQAAGWMRRDGVLLTQLSHRQLPTATSIATAAGFLAQTVEAASSDGSDDDDEDTLVLALRPCRQVSR